MNPEGPLVVAAGEREGGCLCPHCGVAIGRGEQVAVCRSCGTVHHDHCWRRREKCGSYACAPALVDFSSNRQVPWKISADEIKQAVVLPARMPVTFSQPNSILLPRETRRNGLAIAAFITALAGILFFGVITGMVAVLLGCLALGPQDSKKGGKILAVSAILLGLVDVLGWIFFLAMMLGHDRALPVVVTDFQRDPTALAEMPPHLNQAMRASVMITTGGKGFQSGMMGSGCILNLLKNRALIVTNRHVIDPKFSGNGKKEVNPEELGLVNVHFVLGASTMGKVVWVAPDSIDLALVSVEGDLTEARQAVWELNSPIHVGDAVFAIGSPHQLGWTHTQGTISQILRQHMEENVVRVIQTQTPLNPGNSGGGLFLNNGTLVGINTWTNDKRVSEGLGFAISLATLIDLHPPGLIRPAHDENPKP